MTEDFKEWLCKKAGYLPENLNGTITYDDKELVLAILIKAMWVINKARSKDNDNYCIQDNTYHYNTSPCFCVLKGTKLVSSFYLYIHNDSEQDALTAALEYIYKEEKKIA